MAALEPDEPPKKALAALSEIGRKVLAVSHEPLVSELGAMLGSGGAGFVTGQVMLLSAGGRVWTLVP